MSDEHVLYDTTAEPRILAALTTCDFVLVGSAD